METNDNLKILGKICDVLSVIITVMFCLFMPIAFFIYRKNANRHFSIYERWQQYKAGTISEIFLRKAINKTKVTILAFGLPILGIIISILGSFNHLLKDAPESLLLILLILPFCLFYLLCIKVKKNLSKLSENNSSYSS